MPAVGAVIGGIALNLAIGVGASVLSGLLAPQQQATVSASPTSGFSFSIQVGEAVPVRSILGLGRATGQLVYINTYGDNNEFLQYVVKAGHGWHDGLEKFLVNEAVASLSGSNDDPKGRSVDGFTRSGTTYMWVKYYTGASGQAADAELIANANPSGRWTSAHKMTGCAYIIVTCRYDEGFYGTTIPTFGQVWRGLRLYDLRDVAQTWGDQSTYVFTKNPAIVRWNYRRGIFVNGVRVLGMGLPAFANDAAGYTAAANRCDESFYDPETDTTFPVFEYGREIGDDETKLSILSEIDASYCGSSFKRGGGDVPLPAQQMVPTLTLSDNDRILVNQGTRQTIHVDRKGTISTKKTAWQGQFVSVDLGYQLGAYTPRIDTDLESVIGGRRSVTMNQPYESLQQRAQFRAEVALRRQFYPATRTETFGPKALVLEPGDPFTRESEWGSMMMIVEQVTQLSDRAGAVVVMSQWDNAIVPASGDSFIALPIEPGTGPADADRTIAVSGFGMVQFSREGGGAVHPYGKATWTPITDPNVEQVMVRLWPTAGTEATDGQDFFASSKLTSSLLCGPLAPDTSYTYKAIPVRSDGRLCVFTSTGTFTSGDEVAAVALTVPDNSIDVQKFVNDLQNIITVAIPTLSARQDQMETDLGDLAEVAADTIALHQKRITGLGVANKGAVAYVERVEEVAVTATSAVAQLTEDIVSQFGPIGAEALWKAVTTADAFTGISTLSFVVRATNGNFTGEAAWQLGASVTMGGEDSFVNAMADRFNFITTAGDFVTSPFFTAVDATMGTTYAAIAELRFNHQLSIDGTSVEIEGRNTGGYSPFIRIRTT